MKCRTETQLYEFLDKEFSWRIVEISILKGFVFSAKSNQLNAAIRAGVTMLYAHWEGFVKSVSEIYLSYVYFQGHKYIELTDCFVTLGLKSKLNSISSSNNNKLNISSVNFVRNELNSKAIFAFEKAINTKSNLNSETFENIAISIGIDFAKYISKYPLIDIQLLKNRNEIAHGNYLRIDKSLFLGLIDEVIILLRDYKTDIENAVSLKQYRK